MAGRAGLALAGAGGRLHEAPQVGRLALGGARLGLGLLLLLALVLGLLLGVRGAGGRSRRLLGGQGIDPGRRLPGGRQGLAQGPRVEVGEQLARRMVSPGLRLHRVLHLCREDLDLGLGPIALLHGLELGQVLRLALLHLLPQLLLQVVRPLVQLVLRQVLLPHLWILLTEAVETQHKGVHRRLLVVWALQVLDEALLHAVEAAPEVREVRAVPAEEPPEVLHVALLHLLPLPQQQPEDRVLHLLHVPRQLRELQRLGRGLLCRRRRRRRSAQVAGVLGNWRGRAGLGAALALW
mmetsp:Transcript_64699/g.208350  ORF Transcript_64699/g.208350 Transcript_64699/m.208350 type:complete len:294 (-) Transcript_64699:613-1494(-)